MDAWNIVSLDKESTNVILYAHKKVTQKKLYLCCIDVKVQASAVTYERCG